jgi:Tol biopolymer transport system component
VKISDPTLHSTWSFGVSADGRFAGCNRTAGGAMDPTVEVVVRSVQSGAIEIVAHGNDGSFGNSFSPNGRFVAFDSYATDLAPSGNTGYRNAFLCDRGRGTIELISLSPAGQYFIRDSGGCVISADGRYAFFYSGECPVGFCHTEVYRRDRRRGVTECVSLNAAWVPCDGNTYSKPAVSDDGRYLAFDSDASDLLNGYHRKRSRVYVRDLTLGTTTLVADFGDPYYGSPSISSTGRYVSFTSNSAQLVPGDTNGAADVFVWDRGY